MNTQRKCSTLPRGLRIILVPLLTATSLVACGGDANNSAMGANGSGTTGATQPAASAAGPATTAAPGTSAASTITAQPLDPCDPIGTLMTLDLNDRCVGAEGEFFDKEEFAGLLIKLGYWVDQSCPNGALVVAQPNQVLVAVADPSHLDASVTEVVGKLPGSAANTDFKTNLSQVIDVRNVQVDNILKQLPSLQGEGYSTDLNYLEPVQPNYGFRPADDPHPAAGNQVPDTGAGGAPSILVLDSTDDASLYDVDGNGFVDEDHGHGVFVRSIIQRQAPGAAVTLQAVTSSANRLASGRWFPMMFSDADLIRDMEPHFSSDPEGPFKIDTSFAAVNLSLGGAGCTTSAFGYGVGERLALAREMDAFWQKDNNMRFVSAAGNDHGYDLKLEFKHFPAAWRDQTATNELATQVDAVNNGDTTAGDEIRQIHERLANAVIAVAASDGLDYTNCGDWINAVARGTETGNYGPGLATWRGTSFATANESANVAQGQLPNDSLPCPPP